MEVSREELKNLLKEALKESQQPSASSPERKYHTVWEGVMEECPTCTQVAKKALEKLGVDLKGEKWESLKKEVEGLKARLEEKEKTSLL